MTVLADGILLPEDILNSIWFQVFAGFVAFNTIIYLGLTLSKMTVWPRQARLRNWARHLPMGIGGGGSGVDPKAPLPEPPTRGTVDLRRSVLAHDVPVALAWLGGLLIALNVVLYVANTGGSLVPHIVGVALGVVLLAVAQIASRARIGEQALTWTWCVSVLAIVLYLSSSLTDEHNSLALSFAYVIIVAFGVPLVAWRPFIVTTPLVVAAICWGIFGANQPEPVGWLLVALAALGVGALLLNMRLAAITALEEADRLSQRLATTDPLTGLLSQAGMESILPRFAGAAARQHASICVMYIEVPELDRAVREYGHDYGDAVVIAAADAVRDVVRTGDLVARWRTAGFLVAGFGMQPDRGMLQRRIEDRVAGSGVALGKWPIALHAGTAAAPADQVAVDALIAKAEANAGQEPVG